MNKKICILLSMVMVTLSACGVNVNINSKQSSEEVKEENVQVAEEAAEETDSAEETDTDMEDADSEAAVAGPVYKLVEKYYSEEYSGNNKADGDGDSLEGKQVYDGMSETLMVADESKELYPNLYEKLNSDAREAIELADKIASEQSKEANEDADSSADDERPFMGPWTDYSSINIKRADNKVISYTRDFANFYGGAHGMYGRTGITYDVESGERLALTDIVDTTQEELIRILKDTILEKGDEDAYSDLDEDLKNYSLTTENPVLTDPDTDYESYEPGFDWYLGYDGVHFYFGPYEIAAYAVGDTEVVIGYDELPGTVNKDYIPETDKGYIVSSDIPVSDGQWEDEDDPELKFIYGTDDQEYDDSGWINCTSLTLKQGDKSATAEDEYFSYSYGKDSFRQYRVVTAEGKEYIYVCVLTFNDYYDVIVYDITGGDIKLSGIFSCHLAYEDWNTDYAGEFIPTDPDNMIFAEVGDLFGTYICYGRYVPGADGIPEYADDHYEISWSSEKVKSLKDIKVTVLDEDYNEQGEEELAAGTEFTPVRTDNESYMDCVIDDGRIIRLKYSKTDYPAEIDGVSVDDLFDGLIYAG